MNKSLMNINNLYCGYGDGSILNGIDLDVTAGELIGIIGPNGSGKTTLLRAMTGLLKPENGIVSVEDNNLSNLTAREIAKKIAVVAQSIEPVMMNISEYVLMGRLPYYGKFQFFEKRKDIEIAEKFIKLTDISSFKDKLMCELSGGERQRAQIARALVQEPLILLLDEPTSHLDITHQIKILDLIKKLNKELNFTVIMVIHDLNLAAEYCSRLVMLKEGKIYKTDAPEKVLTYKNIEEVYDTVVIVEKNPLSGKPFVIPVTGQEMDKTIQHSSI